MIGAVATAAALIDRNRNGGIGRDVHASRLAGMYLYITGIINLINYMIAIHRWPICHWCTVFGYWWAKFAKTLRVR